MPPRDFRNRLLLLDDGAYDVFYLDKRYLLRKETRLQKRVIKLYAEELGGNDFISFNYYPEKNLLKPCEMPVERVIEFVQACSHSKAAAKRGAVEGCVAAKSDQ